MALPPIVAPLFRVEDEILQYKPYPSYPSWLEAWDVSGFTGDASAALAAAAAAQSTADTAVTNAATALAAANEADDTADAAQATANTAITNAATALAAANEADDTADAAQATANTAITNAATALAAASASPLITLPRRGHFHSDEATYIAGTPARNIDGTYPYAAGLYTTTQNAHLEFYFTCRAGSSLSVTILTQQINNAGILTWYLDGSLYRTDDLYAAVTVKAVSFTTGAAAPITAGDHTLAFKVLTKHASSAGYIMFLNFVQWRVT